MSDRRSTADPAEKIRNPAVEPTAPDARFVVMMAALLLLIAALAAATTFFVADDDAAPPHSETLAADDFPELGLEHVHGLGVDPADGVLYAASHYGVFRLPEDGPAVRVADRYQDTMGFTVTGPNTFLGSGHPDLREDLPSRLGLIESPDSGRTWTPLSLEGKADFHILHAVHGQVYGYDSATGSVMVSGDRRTWETRSRLPLRDFIVDPGDRAALLATTEAGLSRSTDGGRTWQRMPGTPQLAVLAWPATGSLYGIAPDGTAHHSADGGTSWTARGNAGGEPEALLVDARGGDETVVAAVTGGRIVQSRDGGASFAARRVGENP